jgi:hypothetical protein
VGEDDGEGQSGEDDEESDDARDEESKSEGGGDESGGEDEGYLRLSMVSQAATQQPFNLQRRSTGQYFAQELPILESKDS